MAARVLLVVVLGILFSLPLGVERAAAVVEGPITNTLLDTVTVVSSDTVSPGTIAVERVTCPLGMTATGGGVDVQNRVEVEITSSAPTFSGTKHRLLSQRDGTNRAPEGWQGTVLNRSTQTKKFTVGVICASLSGVKTMVGSNEASVGSFASERSKAA